MAHSHEHTRRIANRLSRAIGHLEAVKGMVEEDRDCCEVLTQLAAVKSAVAGIGREILKEHIRHCVSEAALTGDRKAIEDFEQALDRFWK